MTHWTASTFASNSRSISGSATLSAVKSLAIKNTPSDIATSASIVPRSTDAFPPPMSGPANQARPRGARRAALTNPERLHGGRRAPAGGARAEHQAVAAALQASGRADPDDDPARARRRARAEGARADVAAAATGPVAPLDLCGRARRAGDAEGSR